jgi:hypothetical protein
VDPGDRNRNFPFELSYLRDDLRVLFADPFQRDLDRRVTPGRARSAAGIAVNNLFIRFLRLSDDGS